MLDIFVAWFETSKSCLLEILGDRVRTQLIINCQNCCEMTWFWLRGKALNENRWTHIKHFLDDFEKDIQSDGSGSKIFDPGRVNFLWLWSGRVIHWLFGVDFGKFPLKMSNFSIFFSSGSNKISSGQVKDGSASYLLRVKSKLGLHQDPSL